jgi:hypothetical protein
MSTIPLRLEIPNPDNTMTDTTEDLVTTPSKRDEFNQFRKVFDKHMPSSRKPKTYTKVGVLMLSFDAKCTAGSSHNMDVSDEISRSPRTFENRI